MIIIMMIIMIILLMLILIILLILLVILIILIILELRRLAASRPAHEPEQRRLRADPASFICKGRDGSEVRHGRGVDGHDFFII